MEKVSEMLVNLEELDTIIRTLLETRPAKIYPAVASNLNLYRTKLTDKNLRIKEKLQELLPAVKARTSGKSEKDLMDLIKDYNLSPFNKIKSRIFLDSRDLEIKALNLLMEDLELNTKQLRNCGLPKPKSSSPIFKVQKNRRILCLHPSIRKRYKSISIRNKFCLLYTSPSPRDKRQSRMPSSA